MAEIPQAEKDKQLSDPNGFACSGMNAFTITGMVIITCAVSLRFWSRRVAKLDWKADDYTLLVGLVSTSISSKLNAHAHLVVIWKFCAP